ncbi:CgeB family protein [Paenibacillus sp. S-38]|uniref:CgeB family protein n=1 Tax=Paenibacillus sp. S-38 TaxID=3416710 RepID=UPI003CE8A822
MALPQRKRPVRRGSGAYGAGWNAGYRTGTEAGYHAGRCEAVIRRFPERLPPARPVRLMFVVSGQGDPYKTIELGLLESLRPLVAELHVMTPFENLEEAALRLRPDLVLVFNGLNYVSGETIRTIREGGIRTAVWFTDDPYYTDVSEAVARSYDVVFTIERTCVDWYRERGCAEVHFIPLAVSPGIYRPGKAPTSHHTDILFLGSGYTNRVALFDAIAPELSSRRTLIAGRWWERLSNYELLKPSLREGEAWLSPEETVQYYSGAKLVINLHRAHDDGEINANGQGVPAVSPNPRTFEISACGTLQLVDAREGLSDFYVPGQEIETFASPEELVDKIRYYLGHEAERSRIARNALARTLRDHTYTVRLGELLHAAFGP